MEEQERVARRTSVRAHDAARDARPALEQDVPENELLHSASRRPRDRADGERVPFAFDERNAGPALRDAVDERVPPRVGAHVLRDRGAPPVRRMAEPDGGPGHGPPRLQIERAQRHPNAVGRACGLAPVILERRAPGVGVGGGAVGDALSDGARVRAARACAPRRRGRRCGARLDVALERLRAGPERGDEHKRRRARDPGPVPRAAEERACARGRYGTGPRALRPFPGTRDGCDPEQAARERPPQEALAPQELDAHRPRTPAEPARDLSTRARVLEVFHEHLPVRLGHADERIEHGAARFVLRHRVDHCHVLVHGERIEPARLLPLASGVARVVHQDAGEPGEERAGGVVAIGALDRGDEGRLEQVLRRGGGGRPRRRDPQQERRRFVEHAREGVRVTAVAEVQEELLDRGRHARGYSTVNSRPSETTTPKGFAWGARTVTWAK